MLRTVGDAAGALVPAVRVVVLLGLVAQVVRAAQVVRGVASPLARRLLGLLGLAPVRLRGRVPLVRVGDAPGAAIPVAPWR